MTFQDKRIAIVRALVDTGISIKHIAFSKDDIPNSFPSAIVILDGEKGRNKSSKRFLSFEHDIQVFLIADVNNSDDPDSVILELSDRFKANYLRNVGDDIPKIEFYPARADAGRKVRITKVYTVI
jgi:hypothetical protein